MGNRWGKSGNSGLFYFPELQNHCRWWLPPWIFLLFGRKAVMSLDGVFKSRDITLLIKVLIVKAIIFPVVTYGCESWAIKKTECWRIDAFELWCWRRLLRVPWTVRRSNKSILKEINPEYSLERLMLKLKLHYFGYLMQRADSLEKTLMLGKIEGRRRRGWQRMRWLAGITDSADMSLRSWWWTGRPGMLQSTGSQRVRHNWVTELTELMYGKMQESVSVPEIIPFIFTSVACVQCSPWGCDWWLLDKLALSFLDALQAQKFTFGGLKPCRWLWHPCLSMWQGILHFINSSSGYSPYHDLWYPLLRFPWQDSPPPMPRRGVCREALPPHFLLHQHCTRQSGARTGTSHTQHRQVTTSSWALQVQELAGFLLRSLDCGKDSGTSGKVKWVLLSLGPCRRGNPGQKILDFRAK